jgi:uncharacterized protein involved in outer membrane biogenesis
MRRVLIIVSAAVVLLVLVLVVAVTLFNVDRFRPSIQRQMQTTLNRPVQLGELHLKLIPLSIKVDGITIGQPAGFASPHPFATAAQVYVSARIGSLISGKPEIRAVTLQDPQLELIRNSAGVWNWSGLGSSGGSNGETEQFTLDKLDLKNGQVAVTDQRANTPRTVYNRIDLSLTDLAPDKQFGLELAVHLPGRGEETIAFNGKAGPASTAALLPIAGHLSIQQVSLAAFKAITNDKLPPNTDALASGAADVGSANGNVRCNGNLTLADVVIGGTKLAYPVAAQYDLTLNQSNDQVRIQRGDVKIGPTAVSLTGDIESGTNPANLNMRVSTRNASVTDLLDLASLFGGSSSANQQIKGSVNADLNVRGTSAAPNIQGQLWGDTLQLQDIVLTNVHTTVDSANGVVRLSPITAGVFGGQENGTITVDTKAAHPLCTVQANLTAADVNALLSTVSSLKDTLSGALAAETNVTFIVDSGPNLTRTLNGTLGFNVTNGRLKNVNILNELSRVGKFLGSAPSQAESGTALRQLSGTFNIRDGVASTNNLKALLTEGSLTGNGTLNLVTQAIDMRVTAVITTNVSKQVGGNLIGGFMSSALENRQGELVIPAAVTGTMAHPVFTPDMEAMTKLKAGQLLPTSIDPSKFTSGLLGGTLPGLLGQPSNQQNKQKQQQPQNPLNSILNSLGKKKQ